MQAILGYLYAEMKSHPATLVLVIVMGIKVISLSYDHVSRADFHILNSQLSSVQFTQSHDHLDSRYHSIDTEIFNLKQLIAHEKNQDTPAVFSMTQRLYNLEGQKEETLRQITNLEHQPPL